MQSLQQSGAEAQAGLAAANSKAASASKALSQMQQELHQMHDAYRSERPHTHTHTHACTHNLRLMTHTLHGRITMMSSLVAQVGSQSGIRSEFCSPRRRCHFPSVGLLKVLLVHLAILLKDLGGHVARDCGALRATCLINSLSAPNFIYAQCCDD